ncbi:MAG: GNAT family N-acetyltransferase [Betaproteobacteria bacterium]|nr:GNAT family N-acetyltransferase [Betaproteobacteria bacterium]
MNPKNIKWQNFPAASLAADKVLYQEWDRLNGKREGLPFLDAKVITLALEVFGTGNERLLVGREGERIVGMVMLQAQGKFRWITFQPSQLPLGAWVAEKHLSPTGICRSLCRGPLGFCLAVSLTQLDPKLCSREPDTSDSESIDYIETGWIDIDGTFDDYWAARGKNLRQNMKKQRNKLAAEGLETRLHEIVSVTEMAGAIARYGEIESIGWKSGRGTAIHPDNEQGRFYRSLLEQAAEKNEALVYEYFFGDKIVAMNLCLLRAGVLIVLKTTYDESIPSIYSPAFLLSQDQLMNLFGEAKIHRLEYYGRLMDWHTKWTENKRTLFHTTAYRFPLIKRLAHWRRNRQAEAEPA